MYASNNRALKYMRQENDRIERIKKPTVRVGAFNIPLLVSDRASRQKISKHTDDLDRRKWQVV